MKSVDSMLVLLSGRGSTFQAIAEAINTYHLPMRIIAVISNEPSAEGLMHAEKLGIPTQCIPHKKFSNRSDFDRTLADAIEAQQPDWIVLAGFMRILSAEFIARFPHKILNIHPSLLPKYKGLNTHRRVLEARDAVHGSTVHIVTPELDHGPILAQVQIPVYTNDNEISLRQRVQERERQLYPLTLTWLARKDFQIQPTLLFRGQSLNNGVVMDIPALDQAWREVCEQPFIQ
ncbi:MAG: phosphoribosylglycinamide formyltransferase [Pseudomonadota bacterium]